MEDGFVPSPDFEITVTVSGLVDVCNSLNPSSHPPLSLFLRRHKLSLWKDSLALAQCYPYSAKFGFNQNNKDTFINICNFALRIFSFAIWSGKLLISPFLDLRVLDLINMIAIVADSEMLFTLKTVSGAGEATPERQQHLLNKHQDLVQISSTHRK